MDAGAATTEEPKGSARGGDGGDGDGDAGGDAKATVTVSSFFIKESARTCMAAFVPAGMRLTTDKLSALVRDEWKVNDKEMPDILVSCDAGTVHPKMFATDKLLALETFEQFKRDAQQHADMAEQGNRDEFALRVIVSPARKRMLTPSALPV